MRLQSLLSRWGSVFLTLMVGASAPFWLSAPADVRLDLGFLYLLVFCVFFLASRRLLLSTLFTVEVLYGIELVSGIKLQMLGQSLQSYDIYVFIGNIWSNGLVLLNYPKALVGVVVFLLLSVSAIVLGRRYEPAVTLKGLFMHLWFRGLCVLLVFVCGFYAWVLKYGDRLSSSEKPVLSQFQVHLSEGWLLRNSSHGKVLDFVESFADQGLFMPGRRGDAGLFHSVRAQAKVPPYTVGKRLPDLFLILLESTFRPDSLNAYRDYPFPYPSSNTEGIYSIRGLTRVHTFGGGTWLSEFDLLTGLFWGEFGKCGSYAPYYVVPHLRASYPRMLKQLGYHTMVLQPLGDEFINAKETYLNYGFDEVISGEELSVVGKNYATPDEVLFAEAEKRIAALSSDKPVFVFLLTITNHGPHNQRRQDVFPATMHPLERTFRTNMGNYLDRLAVSGAAYSGFEKRWLAAEKPRVVCYFGDHLPSFDGLVQEQKPSRSRVNLYGEELSWFLTPFSISANYPLNQVQVPEFVDISFFSTVVSEAAGIPMDDYFMDLRSLRFCTRATWVDYPDRSLIEAYLKHLASERQLLK